VCAIVDLQIKLTRRCRWSMNMCVGNTGTADSVGFPSLCLQDGPLGLRFSDHATSFPAGVTVGATWSHDLMRAHGVAHGREARLKGIHVLLGPCMGPIGRNPAGGRNWEGFGSDPVLQAVGAYETIQGIQSENVMATAKHYVGNEQEHFRQSFEWGLPNAMSSNIDDRTLHEVYAWPFAESVRAGVASVMCSYQMVNNSYACGNSKLMNGILKDELGFQGFVQSDWLAQRSGVASALAGLDMSMPGDGLHWMDGKSLWGKQLTMGVLNRSVPVERLDDMATRIVASWYQMGQDKWEKPPPEGKGGPNFSSFTKEKIGKLHPASDSDETAIVNQFVDVQGGKPGDPAHKIVARRVAAEGTVLVKNDGILPLSRNRSASIAIIGEDAGPGEGPNACEDRACNQGTLGSGWGSGASEFPYLVDPASGFKAAVKNASIKVDNFLHNDLDQDVLDKLKLKDVCIVFANSDAGEGFRAWNGVRGDRNDLNLQKGGDDLIIATTENCGGPTIVVIHAVGPVIVERWADLPNVKAILLANLPGQESGNALADVLFGAVDASGRLPYTVGKSLEDYGQGAQILYYPNGVVPQVDFNESLYVDYRHFDRNDIEPRYEFGFGLSYTTFELSDLVVKKLKAKSSLPAQRLDEVAVPISSGDVPDPSTALVPPGFRRLKKYIYPWIESAKLVRKGRYPYPKGYDDHQIPSPAGGGEGGNPDLFEPFVEVAVRLNNTGKRSGKEVVQAYVSFPDKVMESSTGEGVDFPPKVLRGFKKIELKPGESQIVRLNLTRKDLSYWSTVQQNWVMPVDGEFKIRVGRSSRDLPLEAVY
jgi:beta-glucosidase